MEQMEKAWFDVQPLGSGYHRNPSDWDHRAPLTSQDNRRENVMMRSAINPERIFTFLYRLKGKGKAIFTIVLSHGPAIR
jgi:hypothetical protein